MSGMNQALAEYFGNTVESEDMSKQAEVEVFCKLAAENGIDLNALTDAQINELYSATFGKTAGDSKEEEERKKREEAAREHVESKKEAEAKFAEAALAGQIMAHSMWAELQEIQKEAGAKDWIASKGKKVLEHGADAGDAVANFAKNVSGSTVRAAKNQKGDVSGMRHMEAVMAQNKARKHLAIGGASAAAAVGAEEGARRGINHLKAKKSEAPAAEAPDSAEKQAAAFNQLAAERAYEKIASTGWEAEEVAARLNAVLTLGFNDEGTKIASNHDFETALEIRSLELAELAGYPIEWA